MRVLVCGGRNFTDGDLLWNTLTETVGITHIIHGAATGADEQAMIWAQMMTGVIHIPFPAKWKDLNVEGAVIRNGKYGSYNVMAGFQRNQRMLDEGKPDLVIAFPGGNGTADMVSKAKAAGIPVRLI